MAGDGFFKTEYLRKDLKKRTVQGGAITVIAQGIKFLLQLGGIVILARVLTPRDFGLVAMVIVITNFAETFKDMGLSMATVQKAELSHDQVSTMFWINVAFGFFVMLVIMGIAPIVSWFYGDPRVARITFVVAISFIFSGLTVQHQALLRRHMRFGTLAVAEVGSIFIGIIVAVISSFCGAGYWSLVFMRLAWTISLFVILWLAYKWRPGLPVRGCGINSMVTFGGNLMGHNFLNYLFRNFDKILIGKFVGSFALGLYSKAYTLALSPIQNINMPLSSVAISALSRLQDINRSYREFYLKAVYAISFVTMPLYIFMFIYAREIILLILGRQWVFATGLFRILCVSAVYQAVTNTTGWLFISSGRTDRMLRWRIATIWIPILFYSIGVYFKGAEGVAYAHTASVLLLTVPCVWYAQRGTSIGTFNVFKVTFRPLFSGIFAGICSLLIYSRITNLFVSFLTMTIFYVVFSCLFARSFKPVKDILHVVNNYLWGKEKWAKYLRVLKIS